MKQIRKRGRDFEKDIDVNYISELNNSYEEWIKRYSFGRVMTINTDDLDFVHADKDFDHIITSIEKELLLDLRLFT